MGIDCSGLTSVSYLLNGDVIYRDADIRPGFEMREIDPRDAKPADLLFTKDHVVMCIGGGKYIHSTSRCGSEGVVVNSLNHGDPDFRQDIKDGIPCAGSIFV
jgi:cell wall-associated NlpC family hydrolase